MEFHKVLPEDPSIVMYAKIAVNQGRSPGLEKDAFYNGILKRADELRTGGETAERAFAKTITEDETGKLLYKAMQIAPGQEVKPVPQETAKEPEHIGPAHGKLHSLAVDHQRAHSGMSFQQAYSYLYAKPENVALRNAIKAEHMRATMARGNG